MDILEFHNKLINKANEFLSDNKFHPELEKLNIFVMLHYLIKSYKLLRGINLLCKRRLNSNAKILLRSLFEAFCLSSYVADKPDDITRAEDCCIRGLIAEKKQIEQMKILRFFDIQTINDDNIKKRVIEKQPKIDQTDKVIMENYNESINRLRKRVAYGFLTAKEVQKKFESETNINKIITLLNKKYKSKKGVKKNLIYKYYASVYRNTSASIHCNDLRDHVDKNDEWIILKDDSDKYTDLILRTSASLFIAIVSNVNKTLRFSKDLIIEELEREYQNCINA